MRPMPRPRTACTGHEDSCARCQLSKQAETSQPTYLLLGPHNAHVREALTQALEAANTPYLVRQEVLALPTLRARVSGMTAAFLEHLPDATTQDVHGVFFSGDLDDAAAALSAFVKAEPLTGLIERARHDWVRDALEDDWLFSLFHPIIQAHTGDVFAHEGADPRPASADRGRLSAQGQ